MSKSWSLLLGKMLGQRQSEARTSQRQSMESKEARVRKRSSTPLHAEQCLILHFGLQNRVSG